MLPTSRVKRLEPQAEGCWGKKIIWRCRLVDDVDDAGDVDDADEFDDALDDVATMWRRCSYDVVTM